MTWHGVRWCEVVLEMDGNEVCADSNAILVANERGPGVCLTFGEFRLYLAGEAALEKLEDAVACARRDHSDHLRRGEARA